MADPAAPTPIEAAIAATPPVTTPAAAPAVTVAAPAVTVPAPAAAPAEAAPAPVVTPPSAPTPAPAAPAPTVAAPESGSLLSDAMAKPPVTPAPAPTPAEAAPPAPAAEPAPLPTYEPFKAPEGVTLDENVTKTFAELLGKYEVAAKADHAAVQQFGQELTNFYLAEQKRQQDALMENFNSMRDGWRKSVTTDTDLGAHNLPTTLAAAGALIEQYGGTAEQQAELRQVLKITGAGDHPAMVRLFRNAGKHLATEGKPVPATNPRNPAVLPKSVRRYPSLSNPNGTGAA